MAIPMRSARALLLVVLLAPVGLAAPALAQVAPAPPPAPAGARAAPFAPAVPGWIAEEEVFYQIFVRSFRDANGDRIGDLDGIRAGLGYLHELGVTSILLTPINPSPFYHNYFASSFEGVDPAYGAAGALRALIEAVHARGMKIYLDEEVQYLAGDHPWWKQSQGNPASPFGRFLIYHGPENTIPDTAAFNLTEAPGYGGESIPLTTVNLREPAVRSYFQQLFASLADMNGDGRGDDGVDGFRLDHMMDDLDNRGRLTNLFADFWAPILARVRTVKPRVRILAEQADWGWGEDWLTRGGADLVFAFPLRTAILSMKRDSIARALARMAERTPPGKGQLLFIENHDVTRFASEVRGDPRRERIGAALNVLLKGTPLIYYGQELGMKGRQSRAWSWGAMDIPLREAFRWSRRVEAPGSATWYSGPHPWWTDRFARDHDGVSVEEQRRDPRSLLSFYRRLLALRRARPELQRGDQSVVTTDRPDVLAVLRREGMRASLLLVNLGDSATTVTLDGRALPSALARAPLRDLLAGAPAGALEKTRRLPLAPLQVKLLTPRREPAAAR